MARPARQPSPSRRNRARASTLALLLCVSASACAGTIGDITQGLCERIAPAPCPESLVIGVAAYVYGYPLLMVDVTKNVATNVRDATTTTGRAPINQFSHNGLPDQSYKDVVLPSVSTPYSNAFLDLRAGPIVLHIPPVGDLCQVDGGPPCVPRFFLMQMIDGWTNVGGADDACIAAGSTPPPGFCGVGSRYFTTPGDYALVGPGWNRPLPAGITQVVRFQTNIAWIAGRHLTTGTAQDIAQVRAIQQQYALIPIARYGKPYTPTTHAPVDPRVDMQTIPRDQVAQMDAATYFSLLADLMRDNPPSPDDAEILAAMSSIGIVPGPPFNIHALDASTQQALQAAAVIGQKLIAEASQRLQLTTTGWSMALDLGTWGTHYLERAGVAYGGLGANLFKDAVYAGVLTDQHGDDLVGDADYRLRFEAGAYPPVDSRAFWSVTLYQRPTETLYDNSNARNALGIPAAQGHLPCAEQDGALVLYIQHDMPTNTADDPNAVCNWLPAPAPGTRFLLLLRLYWPVAPLFDATNPWVPPAVTKQ